jgi:hypothetical protein
MTTFYEFASSSPFLTFFLAVGIVELIKYFARAILRGVLVSVRGWPPAHLDADGDWKPEPKKDDE